MTPMSSPFAALAGGVATRANGAASPSPAPGVAEGWHAAWSSAAGGAGGASATSDVRRSFELHGVVPTATHVGLVGAPTATIGEPASLAARVDRAQRPEPYAHGATGGPGQAAVDRGAVAGSALAATRAVTAIVVEASRDPVLPAVRSLPATATTSCAPSGAPSADSATATAVAGDSLLSADGDARAPLHERALLALAASPAGEASPLRLHVQWRDGRADVWIGLDDPTPGRVRAARDAVREWLHAQGARPGDLVCNGRPLGDDASFLSIPGEA